jgi:hypothetical protein
MGLDLTDPLSLAAGLAARLLLVALLLALLWGAVFWAMAAGGGA